MLMILTTLARSRLLPSLKRKRRPAATDRGSKPQRCSGNGPPNDFGAKGKSTRARAKPLLQWLNARLSISSSEADQPGDLSICNSISLGPLKLRFNGPAGCKANARCVFSL